MKSKHTILKRSAYVLPVSCLAVLVIGSGRLHEAQGTLTTPQPSTVAQTATTPFDIHQNIVTTYFQAGKPAGEGDRGISNQSSAWYGDWSKHMCGIDYEGTRRLDQPGCDSLFYAALPCADFGEAGPILAHTSQSPWRVPAQHSAFKNRWLVVQANGRSVYVQWQDVGPLYEDDCRYVFGTARPRQEKTGAIDSALDISPAAFKLLTGGNLSVGEIKTTWQFVEADQVPAGPWRTTVTTSDPDW